MTEMTAENKQDVAPRFPTKKNLDERNNSSLRGDEVADVGPAGRQVRADSGAAAAAGGRSSKCRRRRAGLTRRRPALRTACSRS